MESCNNCSYKLKEKNKSKYNKPNIYCTKRKCVIPKSDEAKWCHFYDETQNEVLKAI